MIGLIKERFSKINGGLTFEIIDDGVRQDSDWWYVPVIASRNGKDVPRELTLNIYANIETELEEIMISLFCSYQLPSFVDKFSPNGSGVALDRLTDISMPISVTLA